MKKPRILIAGTDSSYVMPFQLKLAENYWGRVDLEVITERSYFNQLFSKPQKADILIISEELFDESVRRHNITNIFVMTESMIDDPDPSDNITFIYKYTSIPLILSEIEGISRSVFPDSPDKKETQVVVVCSACGGTGKTTVAMGISACLSKSNKRVLYINAEHLQTFQYKLENPTPIGASDVYTKLIGAPDDIYKGIKHVIRNEHFGYLPPFKNALVSLELNYSIYEKIAFSAKKSGEYDFIILDVETVFDADKAKLFSLADKVVVVTGQTKKSAYATNMLVSNINGMNGEKYIFICNDFKKEKKNELIASEQMSRFVISEYIKHFPEYETMKIEDIAKDTGMRKTAFLLV